MFDFEKYRGFELFVLWKPFELPFYAVKTCDWCMETSDKISRTEKSKYLQLQPCHNFLYNGLANFEPTSKAVARTITSSFDRKVFCLRLRTSKVPYDTIYGIIITTCYSSISYTLFMVSATSKSCEIVSFSALKAN